MCSLNKVDQPEGRLCRHRFSCPGCSTRLVTYRRLTSLGRKIKTWCFICESYHKVWVPPYISPTRTVVLGGGDGLMPSPAPEAPSGAPSEASSS